ncbi:hypothetical protein TAMA11512_06540 [Selenomonas sp. TAMA-11512]|uniref:hypothetical protein n=1 Tax=Selenomonas sp. TAMA-11512 TaxID=3095337 RepID=UPI003085B0E7|nr:hypothetical protein TAMA11512_06540 [Selenomonas sp. TAMA-11512]
MDVMPMSMQAIIPRTGEASQVQHNLNQQVNIAQNQEAQQGKEDARMKEQQVLAKDNAEGGRVREDLNRNGNGHGYRGNRRNAQTEEEEPREKMAVDTFRGHHIDISF